MDLLVVIALIEYILTPTIDKAQRPNNPIPLVKTLFISFTSVSIVADIIIAL